MKAPLGRSVSAGTATKAVIFDYSHSSLEREVWSRFGFYLARPSLNVYPASVVMAKRSSFVVAAL